MRHPGEMPRSQDYARLSVAERYDTLSAVLTRRGLLRGGGAFGAATALGGPTLLAPATTAASSAGVPVIGRWLACSTDPARDVVVRWQVRAPVTGARVRLGTDTSYGQVVPAHLQTLRTVLPSGQTSEQYYLRADLTGLNPATAYHYRVTHDGGAGGVATDATFRTAPAAGSGTAFTFTAFGDQDVSSAAHQVEKVLLTERPAFHLLCGDISYADSTGHGLATDHYRATRWDDYLAQIDRVASTVPWMVAAGNHDIEAVYDQNGYGGMTSRFSMPGDGPAQCPLTWSMVYGRVAVVALDANEVSTEFVGNAGYSHGAQTAWAGQRLAQLRRDPSVDFVVVVMHQCAYSSSHAHGSDGGVRATWAPLFDAYGVDLVISGHNHVYERTDPLRAGAPTRTAPAGSTVHPAQDGTSYVVIGGGGAALNSFLAPDRTMAGTEAAQTGIGAQTVVAPGHYQRETVGWSRARYTGWCALAVDVDPGTPGGTATLTLRALAETGAEVDTVTLARPAGVTAPPTRSAVRDSLTVGAGVLALGAVGGAAVAVRRHRARPEVPADRPNVTG